MVPSGMLNARQAARLADCDSSYLYAMAKRGDFKAKYIAGRTLFDKASFLAWLEGYQIRRHRPAESAAAPAVSDAV